MSYKFRAGQVVEFTEKCPKQWWFGPHTDFRSATVLAEASANHYEVHIAHPLGGQAIVVPAECLRLKNDDATSSNNFIILPRSLLKGRDRLTRDEAEQQLQELSVPAFIAQIVSERSAVQ